MRTPVNGLRAIHPGENLDDMALTQSAFAEAIGVPPMRVSHVLKGQRLITAELALRLGLALRQTPQYWLNLQTAYDLKVAQLALKDRLLAVRELAAAERLALQNVTPSRPSFTRTLLDLGNAKAASLVKFGLCQIPYP
jgi:addiction module HigA family antidote